MNYRHLKSILLPAMLLGLSDCVAAAAKAPQIPLAFVENRGQTDPSVRYSADGPQFKMWFRNTGFSLQQGSAFVNVSFVNGNPNPRIGTGEPSQGKVNYLRGSDPAAWRTQLPLFLRLRYEGVWPGVDVQFRSDKASPKAEYIVAPGASFSSIGLSFSGRAEIREDGSLVVRGDSGEYTEEAPIIFQENEGGREEVSGGFVIRPDGSVGFRVERYDHSKPLIIDPTVLFSGYFGGSMQTSITAVAVDAAYNTVVTGWTASTDLATSGSVRPAVSGGVDAFVASFSPDGGTLNFCTYLGGSSDDRGFGIAVDSAGRVYVTGQTSSSNFPTSGPLQARLSGPRDAFVAKLSGDGATLIYSTFLGGSGADTGNAIALDSTNSAVVIGDSASSNLPVSTGAFQTRLASAQNAFIAVLSASGSSLRALTYFGGNSTDHGAAIKVDSSNFIYVGGSTYSTNFPTLNAFQPHSGGGQDGFVAKLSADCRTIVFSTYYGGAGGVPGAGESVNAIAIGSAGAINVAGVTGSTNFPVSAGALQPVFGGGNTDAFVGRLKSTGALALSTFLGGSGDDAANALAVDPYGEIYVAGFTASADFPNVNAVQASSGGSLDAFVTKMNFSQIFFSTYIGGSGSDSANAVAIDSLTSIVVVGTTTSPNFRVVGNLNTRLTAALSSFVTKLSPRFTMTVAAPPAFVFDVWHNTGYNGPRVTLNGSSFGNAGDIPVAGDWDGSGIRRIGVFRAGTWLLDINGNGVFDAGDKTVVFGQAGDVPVVGDWNGTGKVKLGLFRRGIFTLDYSGHLSGVATGQSDVLFPFGINGDIPVVADWNHSGTTKVGIFRAGQWFVDYDGDRVFSTHDQIWMFGQSGDIPVTGDWDGSGSVKIGVYRQGYWILDYVGANKIQYEGQAQVIGFGSASYFPLVL